MEVVAALLDDGEDDLVLVSRVILEADAAARHLIPVPVPHLSEDRPLQRTHPRTGDTSNNTILDFAK